MMNSRRIAKGFALVLSFIISWGCSFVLGAGILTSQCKEGISCYATTLPNGAASGTTFTVNDTINDWSQLEGLLDNYTTIKMSKARIYDNDLSHFAHLGEASGLSLIARIDYTTMLEIYPPKILPAYDLSAKKFYASRGVKTSNGPGIFLNYSWGTDVCYVYDSSRDNSVAIKHGVVDENGVELLRYACSQSIIEGVDLNKDCVLFNSINKPLGTSRTNKIVYDSVINGYTSMSGVQRAAYAYSLTYNYKLTPTFLSTVKLDADAQILGAVEIRNRDESGDAIAGAVYGIFEDASCSKRAKQFSGDAWCDAGDVASDEEGIAIINNLISGTYYIKELKPAENYEASNEIKTVTIEPEELDLSLDTSSGEGRSQKINVEKTILSPKWRENARMRVMGFEENRDNYETVAANNYNDGADVFIKKGGNTIQFNSLNSISRLEACAKLSSGKVNVSAGNIDKDFDSIREAVAYVNEELISAGGIDEEGVQDHVTIEGDGVLVYSDSSKKSELEFISKEKAQELDNPVTGVGDVGGGLPLLLLSIFGSYMLYLLQADAKTRYRK